MRQVSLFLSFYPINRSRGKAAVFHSISRHDFEEWFGVEPWHERLARKDGVSYQNRRTVNERTSRNGGIIRTVPNGRAEFFFRREATAAAAAATAFDPAKTAATSAEFLAESSILLPWPTAKQSRISRLQPLSLSLSSPFYCTSNIHVTMLPIYCNQIRNRRVIVLNFFKRYPKNSLLFTIKLSRNDISIS